MPRRRRTGPDIEPMQLREAGLGPVEGDAGADASVRVLQNPEGEAVAARGLGRAEKIRQVAMRIDEAAGIFGKAERQKTEEVLRVPVRDRPQLRQDVLQRTASGRPLPDGRHDGRTRGSAASREGCFHHDRIRR